METALLLLPTISALLLFLYKRIDLNVEDTIFMSIREKKTIKLVHSVLINILVLITVYLILIVFDRPLYFREVNEDTRNIIRGTSFLVVFLNIFIIQGLIEIKPKHDTKLLNKEISKNNISKLEFIKNMKAINKDIIGNSNVKNSKKSIKKMLLNYTPLLIYILLIVYHIYKEVNNDDLSLFSYVSYFMIIVWTTYVMHTGEVVKYKFYDFYLTKVIESKDNITENLKFLKKEKDYTIFSSKQLGVYYCKSNTNDLFYVYEIMDADIKLYSVFASNEFNELISNYRELNDENKKIFIDKIQNILIGKKSSIIEQSKKE